MATTKVSTARRALLAGLAASAALPAVVQATVNPDAALLAACVEYQALHADFRRLWAEWRAAADMDDESSPLYLAWEASDQRQDDAFDVLTDMPARTVPGFVAKARATLTYRAMHGSPSDSDCPEDFALDALFEDLQRLDTGA